jgi:hypothetical protein
VVPTYGKEIIKGKHMANNTIIMLQHEFHEMLGSSLMAAQLVAQLHE